MKWFDETTLLVILIENAENVFWNVKIEFCYECCFPGRGGSSK